MPGDVNFDCLFDLAGDVLALDTVKAVSICAGCHLPMPDPPDLPVSFAKLLIFSHHS